MPRISQLPLDPSPSGDDFLPTFDNLTGLTKRITLSSALSSVAAVPDADATTKGKLQLANDLGGTAAVPTTPTAVHLAGTETITGAKTFNAGTLLDKGSQVYSVKAYGAVGDGVTDDSTPINNAINAASANGGGRVLLPASHLVSSPIVMKTGVILEGLGIGVTNVIPNMTASAGRGAVTISNQNNIIIRNIKFTCNTGGAGDVGAITSYGHNNLLIDGCYFTGTANTGNQGMIVLYGQSAVANMTNTTIQNCTLSAITKIRAIHITPRNGFIVSDTRIYNNRFENCFGHNIDMDVYDICRNTKVIGNTFVNPAAGTTLFSEGLAVYGGIANANLVYNTIVANNQYYNTNVTVTTEQFGFVFIYSAYNTTISNNIAVGSWNTTSLTVGPAFAPGRVGTPDIGLTIEDNFIQGFDSAWDPDSMISAEVANNVVYKCGQGFSLGYGIQKYVNIHDNVTYNSPHRLYHCAALFANSSPVKCNFENNVFIDDEQIVAPTNVVAQVNSGGSLTAATTYYYKVTALDEVGETLGSSEVSGLTTSPNKTIFLSWYTVVGATSYKVYRSTTSGSYGATSLIGNPTTQSLNDNGLTASTGTVPGSNTTSAPNTQKAIELTGNYNYSDITVRNNRFYNTNSTFSSTALFTKEMGSEVLPTIVSGNDIQDTGTTKFDIEGIYALLAGKLGGQTLNGDTAASGNLTLQSTAHATKGKILFGTSAYDEVNNRLGIGLSSPGSALHVNGTINVGADTNTMYIKDSGTCREVQSLNSVPLVLNRQGNSVLIGTTTTQGKLNVDGNIVLRGSAGSNSWSNQRLLFGGDGSGWTMAIASINNSNTISSDIITLNDTGRLGIGSVTAPTTTLHVGGPIATAYAAKTANYTVTATDSIIDCTSGTFTCTLPTAVSITGRQYTIKNSGSGVITVATTSSQTIDGVTTQALNTQYQSISVVSNGSNWIIV